MLVEANVLVKRRICDVTCNRSMVEHSRAWPCRPFFSFFVVAGQKRSGTLPLAVLCRESPDFGEWLTHWETSKTQNHVWLLPMAASLYTNVRLRSSLTPISGQLTIAKIWRFSAQRLLQETRRCVRAYCSGTDTATCERLNFTCRVTLFL